MRVRLSADEAVEPGAEVIDVGVAELFEDSQGVLPGDAGRLAVAGGVVRLA